MWYIPDFVTPEDERYLTAGLYEKALAKEWENLSGRRLITFGGTPPAGGDGAMIKEPLPPFIDALVNALVKAGVYADTEQITAPGGGSAEAGAGPAVVPDGNSQHHQHQHQLQERWRRQPAPRPNHVLCNEYIPGQGINPHKDGTRWYPKVAILSLTSPILFHFWPPETLVDDGSKKTDVDGGGGGSERRGGSESTNDVNGVAAAAAAAARPNMSVPAHSVLCMPRSLLVFEGWAYTELFHGIVPTQMDTLNKEQLTNYNELPGELRDQLDLGTIQLPRQKRASLTLRHVLRTAAGDAVIANGAAEEERTRSRAAFIRSIDS